MNYIPLSVKTHFELLSSLIKIDDLVSFASSNKIEAVGITDSNMFGTLKFFDECTKHNIKPIVGVYFEVMNLNMTLYASNYDGYINLLNLVSIRNTSSLTLDILKQKNKGIICVTRDYNNYLNYKEIYSDVYLSYENKKEKNECLLVSDKIVYIKDNYYINQNDLEYFKYLCLIKDNKTVSDIDNYSFDNALNCDIDENDSKTTYEFSKLIDIEVPKYSFSLPKYDKDSKGLLYNLCNKGLSKRLNGEVTSEYKERLDMELSVISDMNFVDYFLIVYDFILYAKKNGIVVGPGRGSAAGSLVSYSLGITEIDPLKYNLIFERFLNKDRITMPDIDVDIEYLRRDEVVNYVRNKYGNDHVANIITFSTLSPKMAIRDIGRVLKISNTKIDELTKIINEEDTFDTLDNNKNFMYKISLDSTFEKLYRISKRLGSLNRHTSIHAAGVVISDDLIMNRAPIYTSNGINLTGYTMEYLESVGLIKIDFLAIKNLSIIDKVSSLVMEKLNKKINLNLIALDDKKTLDIFYNGDTSFIFQFESEGMKSFLKSLKVRSFDDLVLAIALYRPGPKDNIPYFIKVREGKSKPYLIDPIIDDIIKDTNGIIVYQEQILEILKKAGGFSYSEADIIRRAMSKKKEDVILKYRDSFVKGAIGNGITSENANKIYDLVLKFASYGFNKSHSVAYSFVAYQMAFLKAHFPVIFMSVMLNDSLSNRDKIKECVSECKKYDIKFNSIDINKSCDEFIYLGNEITYPLNAIKDVSKEVALSIMNERNKGEFKSFVDFVLRCLSDKINSKVISSLIMGGAFDSFGLYKKTMIDNLQSIIDYVTLCKSVGDDSLAAPLIDNNDEYDDSYLSTCEYSLFGFYTKNHPSSKYFEKGMVNLSDISKFFNKTISSSVLIENVKVINTKKNERMAFATVSDETGSCSLTLFPNTFSKYDIKKGDVVKIKANVERRFSDYQLSLISLEKM